MTDLSKFSVYEITKALVEQHGFVWDVAFLVAWHSRYPDEPTKPLHEVLAIIKKVKRVPTLSEDDVSELRRKAGR